MVNIQAWQALKDAFDKAAVTLVAVSKTKPASDIQDLYNLGQRHFGENYVQELCEKQGILPQDIHWHFIGHLQSNKVKYIAPFVHLIHTVDSLKLLKEINKEAAKQNRVIQVLLQVFIASEETKFGLDTTELYDLLDNYKSNAALFANITICGLMGMASNTNNQSLIKEEFTKLKHVFNAIQSGYFAHQSCFNTCSMGMSSDYELAIQCGSNMVRIGSLLFGQRNYTH